MKFAFFGLILAALYSIAPAPLATIHPVLRNIKTPQDIIFQESLRAGINPHLPLYIGWRESRYTPNLISPTDDWGVMQLHRSTWQYLRVTRPLDARQNIIAGVGLFAHWLRVCGSEAAAMNAYATGRCR